jgi:hypothetical protein
VAQLVGRVGAEGVTRHLFRSKGEVMRLFTKIQAVNDSAVA